MTIKREEKLMLGWHVENTSPVDGRFFINDASGHTVAEVFTWGGTGGARKHADLAAAAPEMLGELKNLLRGLEQEGGSLNEHLATRIKSLIAKAEPSHA